MYIIIIVILIILIYIIIKNQEEIVYLFLTGGYDSVFRLCMLSIVHNKYIQPIYINVNGMDGNIGRKNQHLEIKKIKLITNKINKINNKKYVLPLLIITEHKLNKEVESVAVDFLSFYKRPSLKNMSQYLYMCSISIEMKKNIETGVLLSESGPVYKCIGKIITKNKIDKYKANKTQIIFRNLLFPLSNMSKLELKNISIKYGFYNILQNTISCWKPDKYDKPCTLCNMCKERII